MSFKLPKILTHNLNVYEPSDDSYLLLEGIRKNLSLKKFKNKKIKVLDLCTGTGIIGLTVKLNFSLAEVICSDISDEALLCTLLNSFENSLTIKLIKSDMFKDIPRIKFDIILCNPPYLKKEDELDDNYLDLHTIDKGQVNEFLTNVHDFLKKSSFAYLILSSTNLPDLSQYEKIQIKKIAEKSFFFEKLFLYEIRKRNH
ncbi:MAG: methyltransferase [Candidatus Anstonellales archaeon]